MKVSERTIKVNVRGGLQARTAAMFVQEANRFQSDVSLMRDGKSVNAKSIMGVMSLVIPHGAEITLRTVGTDAELAMDRLCALISSPEVVS